MKRHKRVKKKDKDLRDMHVYSTFQQLGEVYPFWCWEAQLQEAANQLKMGFHNVKRIVCSMKKAIKK